MTDKLTPLLTDMRCNVIYTDVATMPIPLYERMKAALQALSSPTPSERERFDMNAPMTDFNKLRGQQAMEESRKRMPAIMDEMVKKRDAENDAVATLLADRFLGWELPSDFNPDGGVSFKPMGLPTYGTHLLTSTQAKDMFLKLLRPLGENIVVQARGQSRQGADDGMLECIRQIDAALQAVLCDPEGEPVFHGSDGDRQVIKDARTLAAKFLKRGEGA